MTWFSATPAPILLISRNERGAARRMCTCTDANYRPIPSRRLPRGYLYTGLTIISSAFPFRPQCSSYTRPERHDGYRLVRPQGLMQSLS